MTGLATILARFRSWLAARRLKRSLAAYDRELAEARRAHKPTARILARRSASLHVALWRVGRP